VRALVETFSEKLQFINHKIKHRILLNFFEWQNWILTSESCAFNLTVSIFVLIHVKSTKIAYMFPLNLVYFYKSVQMFLYHAKPLVSQFSLMFFL